MSTRHALVIGASMSGLLAARALFDHFDQVTIVERDELPSTPAVRKGVPQSAHAHGLLASGYRVMDRFFHGMMDELVAQGAPRGDVVGNFLWFQYGRWTHEFFHSWNMERLRSKGIEPFDFEEADVSDDLWLGEGFTSYYDGLIMARAGVQTSDALMNDLAGMINEVTIAPGRRIRSAIDMSRLAPFVDAAASVDRTAFQNTFISHYTFGSAIGLGLDLALRDKTNNRLTLDTYMQALWQNFGARGQKVPGIVATPYTNEALKGTLASVAGDPDFAKEFFAKYIEGHEIVDYARLLLRAGFIVRSRPNARPFLGRVQLQPGGSALRIGNLVPFDSPLYKAGVEQDDQLVNLDGVDLTSTQILDDVLGKHQAGDTVPLRFTRRSGEPVTTTITLVEDPRIEIVAVERAGGTLTPEQKAFREDWLGSQKK